MYVDSAEADTHNSWVAALADSLGKGEAGGYVGFLGEEDEDGPRCLPRLDMEPAPRAETPLRPGQSLPP